MYIILGATGHVGSAVTEELLRQKKWVTVVTRNPGKAAAWQEKGASVALLDVRDTDKLTELFSKGSRLFLLNPPAAPGADIDEEEHSTMTSIMTALKQSSIEKVVALSTYAAQAGERIGDLGILYEMEMRLAALNIPHTIIRAAYYMSNWNAALSSVQQEGKLYSFFPPHFKLPMVAPSDIGRIAAEYLSQPVSETGGLQYIEGPERYSPTDVALAFSKALNKDVEAVEIVRDQWENTMIQAGFAKNTAYSMACMTGIVVGGDWEMPETPRRGATTIDEYVASLVASAKPELSGQLPDSA